MATTNSKHNLGGGHLDQKFTASALNKVWVSDITCISTGEGWLCRAGHKDISTSEIVGDAMVRNDQEPGPVFGEPCRQKWFTTGDLQPGMRQFRKYGSTLRYSTTGKENRLDLAIFHRLCLNRNSINRKRLLETICVHNKLVPTIDDRHQ
nr:hypothetical protein [Geobacter sp. OR-1]